MSSENLNKKACVVFLAGGSGSRMCGVVNDKIFALLAGESVMTHVVRNFLASRVAGTAVFVCRDDVQENAVRAVLAAFPESDLFSKIVFCRGGKERRDSVLNGLRAAKNAGVDADSVVMIHDSARPLVSSESLREVYAVAQREGASVLAHRCVNTIKRVPAGTLPGAACSAEDLERERLWEMETPQAFPLGKILEAYERVTQENLTITDDVSAFVTASGGQVALVENKRPNLKITSPADLLIVEAILNA